MVTVMRRFGFLSLFSMLVLVFSTAAQAFTIDGNVFGVETANGANPAIIENPDWTTPTDFVESGPSNMIEGTGTDTGYQAELAYSLAYEGDDDHYVIELCIPVDAFGGLWGSLFSVQWTVECGNDKIALEFSSPVPEPATSLLLGIGIAAIVASRRKLKLFILGSKVVFVELGSV